MKLRTAVAALAGTACAVLTTGALMAGPAMAAPVGQVGGAPSSHQAASSKIAPRDGTTATALSLSAFQVAFGREDTEVLTVSVHITGSQGGGIPPTGLVRVLEGATEVCRFTLLSAAGQCSPSDSQLAAGPHSLTAVYNGDGRNNPSASVPLLLTVVKGSPDLSLGVPSSPLTFGEESAADLNWSLQVAGTAPTGTVSVASINRLCTVTLTGSKSGTCHMDDTALPPGDHDVFASYSGDGNFESLTSVISHITVAPDQTTVAMTLPAASLSVSQEDGAQITYSITPVVPLHGLNPTGRIVIAAGANIVCDQEVTGFTGTCTLTAGQLPPDTYNLGALYTGDANFARSEETPQALIITPDATTPVTTGTTLTPSATKVTFGHEQAERLSVQVNADSGVATGKVTVKAGSTSVCVITLAQAKGSCALGATKLRPGKYQLTAHYAGSPGFKASATGTRALTVAAEPTATTLKLSAAKVKAGHEQAEHLSVQVKPQFSGTPAGKVTVRAGSVKVCVITLKSGKGSCTLKASQLRAGTYHLAAAYAAAAPYAGSASARKTLTVTK